MNEPRLSNHDLSTLGRELTYIMAYLDMSTLALEALDLASRGDETSYRHLMANYINLTTDQNKFFSQKIDIIALALLNGNMRDYTEANHD